ncbi:MAG: Uma2 family endonuclease [Hormoscilla sp. GUM202]|nr:Uma2 family endonuclease [Hormoscilla sp. GUM202]
MVQSPVEISAKTLSFAEYLVHKVEHGVRYELDRGQLIEMPTTTGLHIKICKFLTNEFLRYFVSQNLNLVAIEFTGVRTEENTSRIPDTIVCKQSLWDNVCSRKGAAVLDFEEKPLLVVEVTSQNWRQDYTTKRAEYDAIGIREYWIVDPERSRIQLCSKHAGKANYAIKDFFPGDNVQSAQFPDLILPVNRVLSPPDVDYLIREEKELRQQLEQQMNAERQRADEERQRADAEQALRQQLEQQMNAERQRADAERQRAEQLAQRLQALGIDPDTIN